MMRLWRLGALLCAVLFALNAKPAQAALQMCNQTSYVLYASAGTRDGANNLTQGWTRVVPGDCRNVFSAPLKAQPYFLYARSSQAHRGAARAWGGTDTLCVKDANFSLTTPAGQPSCGTDDAFSVPFARVDTHGQASWTTTLTETNTIRTEDAARDSGIGRLLGDLGYKFSNRKMRDNALSQFRARMKIVAGASSADLFDALETEAMKTASPDGYSICNDSNGAIWAALALTSTKGAASAGWWKISPGGCAHPMTQRLALDHVFLHVEGHGNPKLVSGPKGFCVTNITFQTTGVGNCKSRGLNEVGFAETKTRGLTGFTAHIGDAGLEPPLKRQPGMPK